MIQTVQPIEELISLVAEFGLRMLVALAGPALWALFLWVVYA